jgi:hypothetical protein
MKLSSALAVGLMTSEYALAAIEKPFDCYREQTSLYGKDEGIKVTDKFIMTGLDAYKSKLAAITGCYDSYADKITGIFTVWGNWENN